MIDPATNLPPGVVPGDECDRADLERDGGHRERELDERLRREEDNRWWSWWWQDQQLRYEEERQNYDK